MLVLVLADTHLRSGLSGMPAEVLAQLERADVVLHAGDVTSASTLQELSGLCDLHAVLGNNDTELRGILPATLLLDLDGLRVGMVHDSGPRQGRARRLQSLFPDADVVVFGHSHIPWNEAGIGGRLLFNPGSPTQRRSQPVPTYGLLRFESGAVIDHRVVPVG
ncbi:MAG TPA: metallophosphoesterase family protein [Acidimicrobiales bacterium]|nr:metallophosphoesterase family protein [Acidimicrobiales bacterium]